jgi:hypothetical protein
MRSRTVRPGFFRNESLAECDPLTRLLFVGLWCLADREGRLEDRPKRIRADALPYDDCDVNAMLDQLHAAGFIIRYEVDGQKLIQITTFGQHQNPHPKELSEGLPPPPNQSENQQRPNRGKPRPSRGKVGATRGKSRSGPPLPSSSSVSSSPSVSSLNTPSECRPTDDGATVADGFDGFWSAYPKKVKKTAARSAWDKIGPDADLTRTILAAIERQKQSTDWTKNGGEYVPHPTSWLNGRRWEDEVLPAGDGYTEAAIDDAIGPARKPTVAELQEMGFVSANGAGQIGGVA